MKRLTAQETPCLEGAFTGSTPVSIPHIWNVEEPQAEGIAVYKRSVRLTREDLSAKQFVEFGAVCGICRVYWNGQCLGEHRGGYSLFRFAVTGATEGENALAVVTDNTHRDDMIPLGGDFNNYGGIPRPVNLIVVPHAHFDLLHWGTNGLRLDARADGQVHAAARVVTQDGEETVRFLVFDGEKQVACADCSAKNPSAILQVENHTLWDGLANPHLYWCIALLLQNGEVIDEVSLPFGFREISLDAPNGFRLNGKTLRLNGVAKHHDWKGSGSTLTHAQMEQDMALVQEIGANALRLSHYQHPAYAYDLCDRAGLIAWAEIPLLAMPDGNEALFDNACRQLTELIEQNRHHPSIAFWGIQNEIAMMGESLEMYQRIERLNTLAKALDSTRITIGANLSTVKALSPLNHLTEAAGCNLYFGWYYGKMADFAPYLAEHHQKNPHVPLCVSEYGVDASIALHAETPKRKDYSEEFQCLYHETIHGAIVRDARLFGSFLWNLFDFGAAHRRDDVGQGENRKGLVTYDREVRKDAFYYYKACWSGAPFVHLAGRRFAKRHGDKVAVKVYTNQPSVALIVNGQPFGTRQGQTVFVFYDVPLDMGENRIEAVSGDSRDTMVLYRVIEPEASYIYVDPNPGFNVQDWFTATQTQDDIFPEGCHSILDEMGTLLDNPQTMAILAREIPQIVNDPYAAKGRAIPLLRVINRTSGQFEEAFVQQLNRLLTEVPKT
jgi:beta-galactosidase